MSQRSTLLAAAATLMVAMAAPTAFANLPPVDDKKEEESGDKKGGNAADKATSPSTTAKPAATNQTSRPPIHYTKEAVEFWGLFLSSGSPFAGALEAADVGRGTLAPLSLEVTTSPPDAPAESVLDQFDESLAPPVLIGEPGSAASAGTGTTSAAAPSAGETPTPPPESILDTIDETPPAPKPTIPQDAAKPAVNQSAIQIIIESWFQ